MQLFSVYMTIELIFGKIIVGKKYQAKLYLLLYTIMDNSV